MNSSIVKPNKILRQFRLESGFTLLEIFLVITLLSVLSGIVFLKIPFNKLWNTENSKLSDIIKSELFIRRLMSDLQSIDRESSQFEIEKKIQNSQIYFRAILSIDSNNIYKSYNIEYKWSENGNIERNVYSVTHRGRQNVLHNSWFLPWNHFELMFFDGDKWSDEFQEKKIKKIKLLFSLHDQYQYRIVPIYQEIIKN